MTPTPSKSITARSSWLARGVVASLAVLAAWAPAAGAQIFGDEFGIAPVNTPDSQSSPVFPGDRAYWAGTCDLAAAPAIGAPLGPLGGVGARPATIWAPNSAGIFGGPGRAEVSPPPGPPHCADRGAESFYPNADLWFVPPAWRLPPQARAGGHPDGTATFTFARRKAAIPGGFSGTVDGTLDNIIVELPAGFVGNPNAAAKCAAANFAVRPLRCPPQSQIGVLHLELRASIAGNIADNDLEIVPVFNLEPRRGNVAELGFANLADLDAANARVVAKARTNGDFGVTTFIGQVPAALPVISQSITIWGVPWAAQHDRWRAPEGMRRVSPCSGQPGAPLAAAVIPPAGFTSPGCAQSYDPSWGPIRPFVTNLTECTGQALETPLAVDAYQFPGAMTDEGDPDYSDPDWKRASAPAPPMAGCDKLPFDPAASFAPTSTAPDSASGLSVDIEIPQNNDPPAAVAEDPGQASNPDGSAGDLTDGAPGHWRSDAGLATSHLDKTVVELPPGMSVNPSSATGLQACGDAEIGVRQVGNPYLFNNQDPFDGEGTECPAASKLGTVSATTPLLDETLTGEFVLGEPKSTDPRSGEMLRTFLVLRNRERGLLAKVYGSAVADPQTGRLTATFDRNPRVPVEDIHVELKGGSRGLMATPTDCGPARTSAVFTPWSAAHGAGGTPRTVLSDFNIGGDCSERFGPPLQSGSTPRGSREYSSFSFAFSRSDGQQWLAGLTAALPKGLVASLRGVPLCGDTQAAAGVCPAGSRIGSVDAAAGAGTPFVLEEKGEVFLTEGYKGCPYGLLVKVRAVAGPFRGAMELAPILVRQAICVDRTSAQVTAVSDALPLIHHGIPLRVREVVVNVDRPAFTLNPSGCAAKRVRGSFLSAEGWGYDRTVDYRASDCRKLSFKPRLTMRLTGRSQITTGKHPSIQATVTQKGIREAGIEKAVVRLPKSLALDPGNAQALCEFEDGTKPDLENHCPKGSIVGRAKATTPLLNRPLAGNVYFVKNVRIDKRTGNEIRTLPMIIVALRGEIAINLRGVSSTTKTGKLVNTFATVPDAPVSRFNLKINGGRTGIIAVTRTRQARIDLCDKPRSHIAEADFDGHNNKRHDPDITMKPPCKTTRRR